METIKIPTNQILWRGASDKLRLDYQLEHGKKYFLTYENDQTVSASVEWENLEWLKKVSGENLERLNHGRINSIDKLKQCIEYRLPMWELSHLVNYKDGKFLKESEKKGDIDPATGKQRLVEYYPHRLSDDAVTRFQADIDRGLFVLAELIPS